MKNEKIQVEPFDPWHAKQVLLSARERLPMPLALRPPARWHVLTTRERELLGGLAKQVVERHLSEGWPGPRARFDEALRACHDNSVKTGGYGHALGGYYHTDPARREEWAQLQARLGTCGFGGSGLLDELFTALVARQLAMPETQDDNQPADAFDCRMNTVDVPRPLLLALAARTGFPLVRVGETTLQGEGPWRERVASAAPAERAELLLSLEGELLRATEGARAWLEPWPHAAADVDDEVFYYGDLPLLHVVRAAMALLPDAVRWPIQRTVAFLGVGISSRAWTGPAAFVDAAGQRKRRIVVLGPSADVLTVLHEIGHVWAAGPSRDVEHLLTAQGEAGLLALAVKEGWRDRLAALDRAVLESEQLADGLAFCWLVRKPGGPTA